ncbi:polysaccharide biosynthesis C-terminal domain-containing protein [Terrimonas sp. NA20]|uniref:Polysaccharide biosynthesis C-terminal domain-containing protein n=1 Tax=Terrimonas ginsenosidimutans TaxID=2908004 RepID=A0ABS9KLI9_9BACT|nr:polysaccharide biosynthesis C-terminal domain-containing protein [Terrimonas ginsenosidimutans]MCG2613140.1 polysaccharide biosynthesis C-terminal domain-containing protein [Terrimonas ginsenosidimutans]
MKVRASFYSSLVWMIVLNVVIKPAWIFGIDRQVQNRVGVEQYGIYFSLFNLSVVFAFLLDWGLTTYLNRRLAMQSSADTSASSSLLLAKLLFSLTYAIIVSIAAWITDVQHWDIVLYVILIQVFYSLLLFLRAVITAKQFFNTDAWLSIIDKSLMLLIAGILLYIPSFQGLLTIEMFAWLQAACLAIAVLIALICLWQKGLLHYLRLSGFPSMKIFRQAFPFALVFLLMSVHARIDAFLLERMSTNGAYETGLYAGAYRLLDAANMVGMLTSSFLLPFIVKRWSTKEDIDEVILSGRHFLVMLATGIALIAYFMGDWIQAILYHHSNDQAVDVLRWCLPALIGYSITHIYGTVLTATGHIRLFCLIVSIAAALNIVLNVLLIPKYGAIGCCLSAICSQGIGSVVVMYFACQKLALKVHFRSVLVYIFTAIVLGVVLYMGVTWSVNQFLLIGVAGALTLLIMLFTGMINVRRWIIR